MAKLILVTVGTSALNKFGKFDDMEYLCEKLNQEAENGQNDEYKRQKEFMIKHLKGELEVFCMNESTDFQTLSAELGSLMAMSQDEQIGKITDADRIVLLYSDTVEGKLCAEVNAEVIRTPVDGQTICTHVSIEKVEGLQVDDPDKFCDEGLKNLRNIVNRLNPCVRDYFVITGGFKGVIPYVSALAWDYLMKLFYLFEKSNRGILIKQPKGWPAQSVFERVRESSRTIGTLFS